MTDCSKCDIEYNKYQKDIEENPKFIHGEYRGIAYVIRFHSSWWCGYIDQKCENTIDPYGEWTGGFIDNNIVMKGFDTSHYGDFDADEYSERRLRNLKSPPSCMRNHHPNFKTSNWILDHIKDLIDSSF